MSAAGVCRARAVLADPNMRSDTADRCHTAVRKVVTRRGVHGTRAHRVGPEVCASEDERPFGASAPSLSPYSVKGVAHTTRDSRVGHESSSLVASMTRKGLVLSPCPGGSWARPVWPI